uniref:Uncharacterized protein n=1 Tax=Mustela putorius furo TaxID=9669 RepID=M3XPE4_MUSPF
MRTSAGPTPPQRGVGGIYREGGYSDFPEPDNARTVWRKPVGRPPLSGSPMDPAGSDGECVPDGTRDMEPPGPDQDEGTGFLSLGVDEEREVPQEPQPEAMSLSGEPGDPEAPGDAGEGA